MNSFLRTAKDRKAFLICLLGIFLIVYVRLLLPHPIMGGDSPGYLRQAENLVQNLCYSTSPVDSAECVPTWGHQPPGYPIFLAFVRIFFSQGTSIEIWAMRAAIIQMIVFALAAIILLWATYSWHKNILILLGSIFLVAFSPLTIVWAGWVLTETLAAGTGLVVFAFLTRSLKDSKMFTIPTGIALAVAVLMRWDQIWLLVPTALVAFYLEGFKKSLKKILIILFVTVLPIIFMTGYAAFNGLSIIPRNSIEQDPYLSREVWRYFYSNAVTQDAMSGFLWKLWSREYTGIDATFNYSSVVDGNSIQFKQLLHQISKLSNGTQLPANITEELLQMAEKPINKGIFSIILLDLQRTWKMWTIRDKLYPGNLGASLSHHQEIASYIWRLILIVLSFLLLFRVRGPKAVLLAGLLSYILVRSIFLSAVAMVELRYLTPFFPIMEILIPFLTFSRRTLLLPSKERF